MNPRVRIRLGSRPALPQRGGKLGRYILAQPLVHFLIRCVCNVLSGRGTGRIPRRQLGALLLGMARLDGTSGEPVSDDAALALEPRLRGAPPGARPRRPRGARPGGARLRKHSRVRHVWLPVWKIPCMGGTPGPV